MENLIYYVEDDSNLRMMFHDFFSIKGYSIRVFDTIKSIEDALKTETIKPQIIISDQKVHDEFGWEFLKRSILTSPDSIRIIYSGYSELELINNSYLEARVDEFIPKSLKPSEIEPKIIRALTRWKSLQLLHNATDSRDEILAKLIHTTKELKLCRENLELAHQQIEELKKTLKHSSVRI